MKVTLIAGLIAAACALSACGTTGGAGLVTLTNSLNARGCATEGSANASAGISGASIAGNVKWACGKTGSPVTSVAVGTAVAQ